MTLSATDILELQHKVSQLGGTIVVTKNDEGYYVDITYYEHDYGMEDANTFITYENESDNYKGTYNYETMMLILDEAIRKEEEYQLKQQKRQELLDRLTDEEKELLGIKS